MHVKIPKGGDHFLGDIGQAKRSLQSPEKGGGGGKITTMAAALFERGVVPSFGTGGDRKQKKKEGQKAKDATTRRPGEVMERENRREEDKHTWSR